MDRSISSSTGEPGMLANTLTSPTVTLTTTPATLAPETQLANLSTRGIGGSGPRSMIVGFVVSGTRPKTVHLRAAGPTLATIGVTGTLAERFDTPGTDPGRGVVRAKTGTLNATNTLSGYLTTASGRELTFSILANDVPEDGRAVPAMDAALLLIAAAN